MIYTRNKQEKQEKEQEKSYVECSDYIKERRRAHIKAGRLLDL